MSLLKAKYYDKPDGEDLTGKCISMNRVALQGAFAWSTVDVLMVSHPKGYLPTLSRYLYFCGPAAGMATAFAVGTYAATRLRGSDDKWSYIVGAVGAGGVFGAWQRNAVLGFVACGALSIAACMKKLSLEEGWEFFPSPEKVAAKHGFGSLRGVRHDYTLMAERERGWTTGKE